MTMNYIIVSAVIVFFLLIYPLTLKFTVYYSTEQKRAYYTIKLFGISLYSGYVQYSGGKLTETNFLGNKRLISLKSLDLRNGAFPDIGISLLKRANFTKLNLFFETGMQDNLFYGAMSNGLITALVGVLFSEIRRRSKIIKLNSYVVTKTDRDIFEITLSSDLSVSIIGVVISIITDFIKAGKKDAGEYGKSKFGKKLNRTGAGHHVI